MGYYTQLHLQVELKKDTPDSVIKTLLHMLGETHFKPEEVPFECDRWEFMLRSSSFYCFPRSFSRLFQEQGKHYLFVQCDFKNYTGELNNFLSWISPYVDNDEGFMGYSRAEDQVKPTLLYKGNF